MWVLEAIVDGETASSVVGERATVAFHSNGMFVASTGCRTLTGTYVAVGDQIETPQLRSEGECSADLETQDGHVVEVFEGGYTVDIDGDRLTLTAAGNHSLVYRSSGASDR